MKITRAVITAAGRNRRLLPLQTLIDRDGNLRSVLAIILNEVWQAGVEECCLVVCPGDEDAYREAAEDQVDRLHFVTQAEPLGYGHAVYCARPFVEDQPFLHMMSDHIYISGAGQGCARQLVETAINHSCAVSGVQATRENLLPFFGTVGGQRVRGTQHLFQVEEVIEKPTPTQAEQSLFMPGLRLGHYLCFLGIHVLTPRVMSLLEPRATAATVARPIALSPTLHTLAQEERYLAQETVGRRYPLDSRYGLLTAQVALAMEGQDREEVLATLCELLAQRHMGRAD